MDKQIGDEYLSISTFYLSAIYIRANFFLFLRADTKYVKHCICVYFKSICVHLAEIDEPVQTSRISSALHRSNHYGRESQKEPISNKGDVRVLLEKDLRV